MSTSGKSRRVQQSHRSASRRLLLEGLENRSVLAGNVLTLATGGHLTIFGDGDANGVHIQTMADGTVEVGGLDAGGSATMINGSAEPFVTTGAQFMTRVHLGNGDDILQIDSQASTDTGIGANPGTTGNGDAGASNGNSASNSNLGSMIRDRLHDLLEDLGIGNGNGFFSREHLLINTGSGNDTVNAQVDANVDIQLQWNLRGDNISIQTITAAESGASTGSDSGSINSNSGSGVNSALNAGLNANLGANLGTNLGTNASANLDANANANANADANLNAAVNSALNTDLNAAIDAVANTTAGGIGTSANLDSNLIANLAGNTALNRSANLGTSSLLNNADTNLNGAVGGSAALNLAGDGVFDEIGLFNLASLANMNAQAAANAALANANSFGLSQDAVDRFFANQANANADTSVLGSLAFNDQMGNGSLNTNIFSGLNSGFQAREGLVPMG